ncbi:hypothetical protein BKA93DRAFT_758348 [Sparassis latifolia]
MSLNTKFAISYRFSPPTLFRTHIVSSSVPGPLAVVHMQWKSTPVPDSAVYHAQLSTLVSHQFLLFPASLFVGRPARTLIALICPYAIHALVQRPIVSGMHHSIFPHL